MSKWYKLILAICFILSLILGAQYAYIDNMINININNSKKYITTPSVPK